MADVRILDIVDAAGFALLPPCADPGFDHRSCDYWEDADRGSRASRGSPHVADRTRPAPSAADRLAGNPFAPLDRSLTPNPFLERDEPEAENPFLPRPAQRRGSLGLDVPRKLQLLTRGIGIFGSYAKVLLVDEAPAAYVQFGPLSAYPRALRLRELYPQLPQAPLPAIITCVAVTAAARSIGLGQRLVRAVCDDLAGRGFSAVETYPERGARPDATSMADPPFWERIGFRRVVEDDRFPVYRLELE